MKNLNLFFLNKVDRVLTSCFLTNSKKIIKSIGTLAYIYKQKNKKENSKHSLLEWNKKYRLVGIREVHNGSFWNDYKDIKIIATISKSILNVTDKKGNLDKEGQYVVSTVLFWNDIDFNKILNNFIRIGWFVPKLKIIRINFNELNLEEEITEFKQEVNISGEDEKYEEEKITKININSSSLPLNNVLQSTMKVNANQETDNVKDKTYTAQITLHDINLYHFFKNLDKYITELGGSTSVENTMNLKLEKSELDRINSFSSWSDDRYTDTILPSPIFIFEGISWSNIVLLFKLNGISINGGSISRRHKLNINEYKLSLFLAISGLLSSRLSFYRSYKDNIFLYPKIKKLFYNGNFILTSTRELLSKDKYVIEIIRSNPIIFQYILYNLVISVNLNRNQTMECIQKLEHLIFKNDKKLNNLEDNLLHMYKNSNIKNSIAGDTEVAVQIKKIKMETLSPNDKLGLAVSRNKDKNQSIESIKSEITETKKNLQDLDFELKDCKYWLNEYNLVLKELPHNVEDFFKWVIDKEKSFNQLEGYLGLNLGPKALDLIKNTFSVNKKSRTIKKDINSIRSYSTNRMISLPIDVAMHNLSIRHYSSRGSVHYLKTKKNQISCSTYFASSSRSLRSKGLTMDQVKNNNINLVTRANKVNNESNKTAKPLVIDSASSVDILNTPNIVKDNFIYDELIRILLDNPHNVNTQLKIEQFLLDQSKIIIEENLNKDKDINYTKLATYPKFLKILKDNVPLIESLLSQIRDVDTEPVVKQKKPFTNRIVIDPKYYNYKWIELIKNSSNSTIVNLLLGRVLRIICNNSLVLNNINIFNNNTLYTKNAMDIGADLINQYMYNLYVLNIKNQESLVLTDSSSSDSSHASMNTQEDARGLVKVTDGSIKSNKWKSAKQENYTFSMWKSENISLVEEYTNNQLIFNIGSQLLNILMDLELLVILLHNTSNGNKKIFQQQILALGPIFANIETNSFLTELSYRVPMIVKPKEWKREKISHHENKFVEKLGGFLNNDIKFTNPLIIDNWELKKKSRILDPNVIYKMVNNLQSIPFKINIEVLDFIKKYGIEYDLIIDPNYKHPLEVRMSSDKVLPKEKKEANFTYNQRKTLESFLSKKKLESNILGLANVYRYVKEFYIPVRIDNRGRVYCNVDYLNYQSTDLAKALLLFSRGNRVSKTDQLATSYLKIYGANCFGHKLDKKSFEDRIKWVNENEIKIINLDSSLLKKAENKLLFLAFSFEYIKYYKFLNSSNKYFITNLPIQLDATCNGFQHLALLTGDEDLAKHLNLTPSNWYDQPDDFYSFLALNLNEYFKDKQIELNKEIYNICIKESDTFFKKLPDLDHLDLIKTTEDKVITDSITSEDSLDKLLEKLNLYGSYSRLANINIHRKIIKKPAMTKIYNVTLYSMAEYIKEEFNLIENKETQKENWYEYKNDPNIKIKGKDIYILGKAIDTILYVKYPKYNKLNEYLKKIARICIELQIPIPWVLPSGLEVMQSYVTSNEIKLKPFKYRKNTFILKEATEIYNSKKQIRALMPNLVHSLDAASLSLLTDMFFNYTKSSYGEEYFNIENPKNLFAIHDCFATTCNYLDIISNYIKTVYYNIYSNKAYLFSFDEGIRENIKLIYGSEILHWENNKWIIRLENKTIDYPDIFNIFNVENENVELFRDSSQVVTKYDLNELDLNSTLTSQLRNKGLGKLANRLEDFYSNILKSSYPVN